MKQKDAGSLNLWYSHGMKRNRKSTTTSPEIITKIAEMTEKNLNLLTQLGERLEANEKEQFRFKMVVVNQLSRIEAIAEIIRYSILVEFQWKYPEKLEELVQEKCNEISGRMINRLMGVNPKAGYGRNRKTTGIKSQKNVNEQHTSKTPQ